MTSARFTSRALVLGEGLPMIGKLSGIPKCRLPVATRIWRGSR